MSESEDEMIPGLPLPYAVDWDIRRAGRAWRGDEARARWELTPEKFEMWEGKVFFSNQQRLLLLGLLLENVGVDAAVQLGDPRVWKDAVAARTSHTEIRESINRAEAALKAIKAELVLIREALPS